MSQVEPLPACVFWANVPDQLPQVSSHKTARWSRERSSSLRTFSPVIRTHTWAVGDLLFKSPSFWRRRRDLKRALPLLKWQLTPLAYEIFWCGASSVSPVEPVSLWLNTWVISEEERKAWERFYSLMVKALPQDGGNPGSSPLLFQSLFNYVFPSHPSLPSFLLKTA